MDIWAFLMNEKRMNEFLSKGILAELLNKASKQTEVSSLIKNQLPLVYQKYFLSAHYDKDDCLCITLISSAIAAKLKYEIKDLIKSEKVKIIVGFKN